MIMAHARTAAAARESKDAEGIVIVANDVGYPAIGAGWVRFLETAFEKDGEFELNIGKASKPPIREGTTVYLLRGGYVRCALPAASIKNTHMGWVVMFGSADVRQVRGVAIAGNVLAERWAVANGRRMSTPLWFPGWRQAWWKVEDEGECAMQSWALADLSADVAMIVRPMLERWPRVGGGFGIAGGARAGGETVGPAAPAPAPAYVSVAQRPSKRAHNEPAFAPSSGGVSGVAANKGSGGGKPGPGANEPSGGQGSLF